MSVGHIRDGETDDRSFSEKTIKQSSSVKMRPYAGNLDEPVSDCAEQAVSTLAQVVGRGGGHHPFRAP